MRLRESVDPMIKAEKYTADFTESQITEPEEVGVICEGRAKFWKELFTILREVAIR
jgi:hypothetical protein